VWIFSTVDPDRNALAASSAGPLEPAVFRQGYLPQYFTINGKSGFFGAQHGAGGAGGAHDHGGAGTSPDAQSAISIHGNVGQPCLIRNLNAGMMCHSPHIHGNHVYLLSSGGRVLDDLEMVDTWTLYPGEIKDVLLPYIRPPDIPEASWLRFGRGENQELFPLLFPMHDHNEISNTAAGGNYPQGLATHFQLDGVLDAHDEVIQVDRAEIRLKTGELRIAGRSSGAALREVAHRELAIHAGPSSAGPSLGKVTVAADGSFAWRGRALKALASRSVTIHNHMTGAERRGIPLALR
jgi:hypothetical protein